MYKRFNVNIKSVEKEIKWLELLLKIALKKFQTAMNY